MFYELELTEFALALTDARLGGVEVRWADPASGESRRQSAALTGQPAARFTGQEGALAHFAAIVALSAARYGLLFHAPESAYPEVYAGLSALLEQLRSLGRDLGHLDAYQDFLFLLEHITEGLSELVPQPTPSGYSR